MNTDKLRYLLAVEEEGSISRAADRLYMSQPTLSKTVASVESSLGCKLFLRTVNGLIPTEEGRRYLQYAREAVALEAKALADLDRIHRGERKFLVTVGVSHLRNAIELPDSLTRYSFEQNNVQIMVRIARDDELIQGLLDGSVDVALITLPLSSKLPCSLHTHTICAERMLLAAAEGYPFMERAVPSDSGDYPFLPPACLQSQRFILSSPGTGLYELCQAFFTAEGLRPNIVMYEDSVQAAMRFAEEGIGVCFVHENLIRLAPSPRLHYFTTAETLPPRLSAFAWKASMEDDTVRWPVIQSIWTDIATLP